MTVVSFAAVVGALAVGYLLGTFPTAELITGLAGKDVKGEGSGNPGASNAYRVAGRKVGATVLIGDMFKGALAAFFGAGVGGLLDPTDGYRLLAYGCGLACVLGHCYPVFRNWRGGRGVASAAGAALVMEPVLLLISFAVWGLVTAATKIPTIASVGACFWIPGALILGGAPVGEVALVIAIAAVLVVRHTANLSKLSRGDENPAVES